MLTPVLVELTIQLEFEWALFLYKRNARGHQTPRAVEFNFEFRRAVDPLRVLPQKPDECIDSICNLFRFTGTLPGSLHTLSIARAFYVSSDSRSLKTSHIVQQKNLTTIPDVV